jgi:uncharacterized protein YtpQ (UPF0354 family)
MTHLPQFFPCNWTDTAEVFGIPFTEEISIGFVTREDGSYSFLLKDDFVKLNISAALLLETSIANLDTEFEECEIKQYDINGGSLVFWYSENDNFTSVRILSTKYSSLLKKIFGSDFSFSIPDRDLISCWQTADENENDKFANETFEDYTKSDYYLSDKVYKYSNVKLKK